MLRAAGTAVSIGQVQDPMLLNLLTTGTSSNLRHNKGLRAILPSGVSQNEEELDESRCLKFAQCSSFR